LVCLSSHGPNSEKLLRYGSRLAGKLNRNWYAIYVQTPSEEATVIDAQTQRHVSETLTLAKKLGAMVFTYKGEDIADTILRFVKEYRVGQIVVGKSHPKPLWKRLGKNKAVIQNLMKNAAGLTIIVLDTCEDLPSAVQKHPPIPEKAPPVPAIVDTEPSSTERPSLSRWISPRHILIWNEAVSKVAALQALASTVGKEDGIKDEKGLFDDIMKREEQGSTFFNEGVAFPHVRVNGLAAPVVALGLTKKGIEDVTTDKPIELVFLLLSPAQVPETQVKLLSLASRAAQNRRLLQTLRSARTPEEAMRAIVGWETPDEPRGTDEPE
jgi:two-component system sensor histidine kinase KdpD